MVFFLILIFLLQNVCSDDQSAGKRLLLHSETDVAQTLTNLQNELDALKNTLKNQDSRKYITLSLLEHSVILKLRFHRKKYHTEKYKHMIKFKAKTFYVNIRQTLLSSRINNG